jgi:hypothetical protein
MILGAEWEASNQLLTLYIAKKKLIVTAEQLK